MTPVLEQIAIDVVRSSSSAVHLHRVGTFRSRSLNLQRVRDRVVVVREHL